MSGAPTPQDCSKVNSNILFIHAGHPLKCTDQHSIDLNLPSGWFVSRAGFPVPADILGQTTPDVAVVLHTTSRVGALDTVRRLRLLAPRVPILLLAEESCETFVIDAFHAGVARFLKAPWTSAQLSVAVEEITTPARCKRGIEQMDRDVSDSCTLVGTSASVCDLRRYIRQVAPSDSNVLITGETGTGKELVAQLIHQYSGRHRQPFVCMNSTAIPEALVESELFGYERGAFTGAQTSHEGKLAAANGGTAFFDEIGDTSPTVQAKLLRAIESRKIYRLGSTRSHDLDIRVLAATNQDLETATQEHRFRSDLYYRLNVIRMEIPPLRERIEDIPALVHHYIRRFNSTFRKNVVGLYPGAIDQLLAYHWPGNIRELRNVMEAAFANLPSDADEGVVDLPHQVTRLFGRSAEPHVTERISLVRALTATNWNRTEAAKSLHWSRMTLYRKMVRYQISTTSRRGRGSE